MIAADAPDEAKHRHLRALYRQHKPSVRSTSTDKMILDQAEQVRQRQIVAAEYERLYGEPSTDGSLERILTSAWIEERELRGERYDRTRQDWVGAGQ